MAVRAHQLSLAFSGYAIDEQIANRLVTNGALFHLRLPIDLLFCFHPLANRRTNDRWTWPLRSGISSSEISGPVWTIVKSVGNVFFTMRTIVTILGVIAVFAFAGFIVKGTHQKAAICDTADCPASDCP